MRTRLVLMGMLGALQAAPAGTVSLPTLDSPTAVAIVLEAEDRRVVTAELRQLTEATDAATKARAALALARVGDPTSLTLVARLAGDRDVEVRRMAAFALGRLEFELVVSGDALRATARDLLLRLLDDVPPVASQAGWALGHVDGGAGDALARWLNNPSRRDPGVLAAVINGWWRLSGVQLETILPFAAHPEAAVRLAVAHSLRRAEDPNRLPRLIEMLADADDEVRLMAARGLQVVPAGIVVDTVVPLLRQRDIRFVCALLESITASWQDQETASDDAFEAVLRRSFDRSAHVRRGAVDALGTVLETRAVAVDRLLEALGEPVEAVRVTAIRRLAAANDATRREAVRRLLPDESALEQEVGAWRRRPAEAAAIARLVVAAGRTDLIDRWASAESAEPVPVMLPALAAINPRRVYDAGLARPLTDPVALQLIAAAHRAGGAPSPSAVDMELSEKLWRLYYDSPVSDPLRARALRTLNLLDPELLARRRELVLADPDRSIRAFALQQWGGQALPGLDVVLAPAWTGRSHEDYERLAEKVIRLRNAPPRVRLETREGEAVFELRADWAPLTVVQFSELLADGFYDDSLLHRVIAGFVTQGGGAADGRIAPLLRSEDSPVPYDRGVLGLAHSGRDTARSQFFFTHAPQPHLTGEFPVFARILEGSRVIERIQPGDRMRLRVVGSLP